MSIFDDIGNFLSNVWHAITEVFSPSPPAGPSQPCPAFEFEAKIVGVQFNSPVTAARRGAAVSGEHWTDGVDVNEPNVVDGSTKPAIVLIDGRGNGSMTVRIRVTKSQNVAATGSVSGYLGNLAFEGTCPTGVGDHSVSAKISHLPRAISRDAGDATWSMDVDPIGPSSLGSTRLEVMTILDNPPACFAGGIWIEPLRAMSGLGVLGLSEKRKAAAAVARLCHSGIGARPVYDTQRGASAFNAGGGGANGYRLAEYISPGSGKVVNCYDQAAAVSALAGALGVTLGWRYMEPFGFLAQIDLVGVGQCNNPFPRGQVYEWQAGKWVKVPANPAPLVPPMDPRRSSFGNHAFTAFASSANTDIAGADSGVAEGIGDACAGPAVFDGTLPDYVTRAVDQTRHNDARRATIAAQLQVVDAWETQQIAAINGMTWADSSLRDAALAAAHDLAEQARATVRAQLTAEETRVVVTAVGVNSVAFVAYSGP